MCTLVASIRQHDNFPVIIAANRDEILTRPATVPRLWPGHRFVAPRDELAHGSWLGVNANGLFVGVTNRFGAPRLSRESRGTLVVEALEASSAASLHSTLSKLSAERFNAFHLLYADADEAGVTWSDGSTIRQHHLPPGLHVVTERSLGGDDRARTTLIHELWEKLVSPGQLPTPLALQSLLSFTRPEDPLGGVCVEAPEWNYGTRSSLVCFLARSRIGSRFFWAEGRPDRTPFVDRSDLLESLGTFA
jgi:uncharacterized protein with NRDE domain